MTSSTQGAEPWSRRDVLATIGLVLGHALACVVVRAGGFDHVSDDDFARVTIAQAFAHAPKLDPTGTSWLPFPFWSLGAALAVFGRSLETARIASIALSSLAVALPYIALRYAGAPRLRGVLGVAFAVLSPWSLWLGAATVPESFTASFLTAAALGLGVPHERRRASLELGFGLALFFACLSRYEAWPIAATLAVVESLRAFRHRRAIGRWRSRDGILAFGIVTLAVMGPVTWMAWNAYAHGSAIHFFHRVTNYKRAIGEGSTDAWTALLLYPRVLLDMRPDVVAAFVCAVLLLRDRATRRRYGVPLTCAGVELVFLAYGNVRDGAPAHHPERALLAVVFLLATCSVDVIGEALPRLLERARVPAIVLAALLSIGWIANARGLFGASPGSSESEARDLPIARGNALRDEGKTELTVTPCAFEHFALIAAYGAPERVTIRPKTGASISEACPTVDAK